jgi:hypothetical protein
VASFIPGLAGRAYAGVPGNLGWMDGCVDKIEVEREGKERICEVVWRKRTNKVLLTYLLSLLSLSTKLFLASPGIQVAK